MSPIGFFVPETAKVAHRVGAKLVPLVITIVQKVVAVQLLIVDERVVFVEFVQVVDFV